MRHHLPYVGVIVLSPEQVNVEIYSTVELSICVSNPQENNTYFLIRVNPGRQIRVPRRFDHKLMMRKLGLCQTA